MTRTWTLREAQAALPMVERLMEEGALHWDRWVDAQQEAQALVVETGGAAQQPGHPLHDELRSRMDDIDAARRRIDEVVGRLDALGVEVKGFDQGLVDFRSRLGDQEVYLCWRRGEAEITAWHTLAGGFAGRRPIPTVVTPASLA